MHTCTITRQTIHHNHALTLLVNYSFTDGEAHR